MLNNTVVLPTCMCLLLFHTGVVGGTVTVSFDPTTYTVTEGVDDVANLMLVRSGGLTRTVVVTVTLGSASAMGNDTPLYYSNYTCTCTKLILHNVG